MITCTLSIIILILIGTGLIGMGIALHAEQLLGVAASAAHLILAVVLHKKRFG